MKNSSSKKTIARAIITTFTINFILNGVVAWLLHLNKDYANTNFWSIIVNISITVYVISLLNSFFSGKSVKRYIEKRNIEKKESNGFLANISERPFYFGFSLIGIIMVPLAFVVALIFELLGILVMPVLGFVIFKAIFGGIYGAFVTYLVILRAKIK